MRKMPKIARRSSRRGSRRARAGDNAVAVTLSCLQRFVEVHHRRMGCSWTDCWSAICPALIRPGCFCQPVDSEAASPQPRTAASSGVATPGPIRGPACGVARSPDLVGWGLSRWDGLRSGSRRRWLRAGYSRRYQSARLSSNPGRGRCQSTLPSIGSEPQLRSLVLPIPAVASPSGTRFRHRPSQGRMLRHNNGIGHICQQTKALATGSLLELDRGKRSRVYQVWEARTW